MEISTIVAGLQKNPHMSMELSLNGQASMILRAISVNMVITNLVLIKLRKEMLSIVAILEKNSQFLHEKSIQSLIKKAFSTE